MKLVRAGRSIQLISNETHFVHGSIGMLNVVDDSSTPTIEEREDPVRALALSEPLSQSWSRLDSTFRECYALRSISPQHVDTTFCVSDAPLWLRTTLFKHDDDSMIHSTWMSFVKIFQRWTHELVQLSLQRKLWR